MDFDEINRLWLSSHGLPAPVILSDSEESTLPDGSCPPGHRFFAIAQNDRETGLVRVSQVHTRQWMR
jgi:hypothetical protein